MPDMPSPIFAPETKVNPMAPGAPAAPGLEAFNHLVNSGATLDQAQAWKDNVSRTMLDGGASAAQVEGFWGDSPPDTSLMASNMRTNFGTLSATHFQKIASDPWQAIQAGFQNSNLGIAIRGKAPSITTQGAGLADWLVGQGTGFLADLPEYLAGGVAGAATAGAAGIETGLGDVGVASLGAYAGANALEGATRQALMHYYSLSSDPPIQNFKDFSVQFLQAMHNTLGDIATGMGMATGEGAAAKATEGLSAFVRLPASALAQASAMTAVTSALSGHVPTAADFGHAAILALGLTALPATVGRILPVREAVHDPVAQTAENLRQVYAETGVSPKVLGPAAIGNEVVRQEVLAPFSASGDIAAPAILQMRLPEPPAPPPPPSQEPSPAENEGETKPPIPEHLPVLAGTPRTNSEVVAEAQAPDVQDRALALQGDGGGWEPPIGERAPGPAGEEPGAGKEYIGTDRMRLNEEQLADKVLDRVVPPSKGGFHPWLAFRRLVGTFQSQLTPAANIDKILKGEGILKPGMLGIEDMFRQVYGAAARASYFLFKGSIGLRDSARTPGQLEAAHISDDSYKNAMRSVTKNGGTAKGFMAYRLYKRALELQGRGIDTGIDAEDAKLYLATSGVDAKYAEAHQIIQRVKHNVVQYVVDSGLMSQSQADAMFELNMNHISMRRLLNQEYKPWNGTGTVFGVRVPFKKIEGSELPVIDPNTTEVDNVFTAVAMADRNRARLNVIDAINAFREKLGEAASKIPGFTLTHRVSVKQIEYDPGLDGELYDAQGRKINMAEDANKTASQIFLAERRLNARLKDGNDFVVYRDGNAEVWRAENEDLATLMRMQWQGKVHPLIRLLQAPARLVKLGIAIDPSFIARAMGHAEISSSAFAEHGQNVPFADFFRGIFDVLSGSDAYSTYQRHGGGGALLELDQNMASEAMGKLFDETGVTSTVFNRIKHPIQTLRAMQHMLSDASRVGYMKRMRNMGWSDFKAVSASRKAYIDFAEPYAENWVNTFARMIPFMEVGTKSIEQFGEMLGGAREAGNPWPILKAATILTLPTMLNFVINYYTDKTLPQGLKYADQPRWVRRLYWTMPPINGVRYRVKKPYGGAFMFSTVPEMMMERFAENDPHAFNGWAGALIEQYMPPYMATFLAPIAENWANKNFYTGRPIIPASLQHENAWLQFEPNTSPAAKSIARWLGPPGMNIAEASPMMLQTYMNEWLGTMPMNVLNALATGGRHGPQPQDAGNSPFWHSFIARNPDMGSQPITDFYTDYDKVAAAHQDLIAARKEAVASGDTSELQTVMHTEGTAAMVSLTRFHTAITNVRKVIQAITANPGMTAIEKRQYIDGLIPVAIQFAKTGDELARSVMGAH